MYRYKLQTDFYYLSNEKKLSFKIGETYCKDVKPCSLVDLLIVPQIGFEASVWYKMDWYV